VPCWCKNLHIHWCTYSKLPPSKSWSHEQYLSYHGTLPSKYNECWAYFVLNNHTLGPAPNGLGGSHLLHSDVLDLVGQNDIFGASDTSLSEVWLHNGPANRSDPFHRLQTHFRHKLGRQHKPILQPKIWRLSLDVIIVMKQINMKPVAHSDG